MKYKLITIASVLAIALGMSISTYAADFVRPMPTKPMQLGPTVLGGEQPVVCSPLVANNLEAIKKEAATVKALNPDMVEVRADYWDFIEDTDKALEALREIRNIIGDTPILLTVRRAEERGYKPIDEQKKFEFYKKAAAEKLPNLIDIELALGKDKIQNFKQEINGSIPIVVAYHDLKGTPSKDEIIEIISNSPP